MDVSSPFLLITGIIQKRQKIDSLLFSTKKCAYFSIFSPFSLSCTIPYSMQLKITKPLHRTCNAFCSVYGNLFVMKSYSRVPSPHKVKIYCTKKRKKLCSHVNIKNKNKNKNVYFPSPTIHTVQSYTGWQR